MAIKTLFLNSNHCCSSSSRFKIFLLIISMIVFAILIFSAFLTTIVPVINRLRKRNIYSTVKVSSDSIPCEKGDFNGRLVKQSWRNFQRWVSLRSIQHFQFGQKFTRGGTLKPRDNSESNLILKLCFGVASRKHYTRVLNQDSWYKYGLNFTISGFIEDHPVLKTKMILSNSKAF